MRHHDRLPALGAGMTERMRVGYWQVPAVQVAPVAQTRTPDVNSGDVQAVPAAIVPFTLRTNGWRLGKSAETPIVECATNIDLRSERSAGFARARGQVRREPSSCRRNAAILRVLVGRSAASSRWTDRIRQQHSCVPE